MSPFEVLSDLVFWSADGYPPKLKRAIAVIAAAFGVALGTLVWHNGNFWYALVIYILSAFVVVSVFRATASGDNELPPV